MRMLRVLSIVLAVVVSGCELVTDPNDDPRGTRLPSDDFSARLVQSGDAPLPELLIRGVMATSLSKVPSLRLCPAIPWRDGRECGGGLWS